MQPLTDVNSSEDQVLLKGITGDRSLSATSKKAYAMRLRLLATKRRKPILDIILEVDQSLAWLRQTYIEVCTRKGFISAVLAAVRQCPPKFALRLQKAHNSGYKNCYCLTMFCNKGIRAICQLQGKLQAMCHGQTLSGCETNCRAVPKPGYCCACIALEWRPCVQTTIALLC